MSIVYTATARVADWQQLRALHDGPLARLAEAACASRLRIYRDVQDAARVLIVADLPDPEACAEWHVGLCAQAGSLLAGHSASAWEVTGWECQPPRRGAGE